MTHIDSTKFMSNHQEIIVPAGTLDDGFVCWPTEVIAGKRNDIPSVTENADVLTGSADVEAMGPSIGMLKMMESNIAYYFRVSLPGVAKDDFTCDISPDGQVVVKGVTTIGAVIYQQDNIKCEDVLVVKGCALIGAKIFQQDDMKCGDMVSKRLPSPSSFEIRFNLLGPVGSRREVTLGRDGVLEGAVAKKTPAN